MSDLQSLIDRINYVRQQGYITQQEAQDLRDLANSRATKKGDLTQKEKDLINNKLNDALNKKGKADKADGGIQVPSKDKGSGGTGSGGTGSGGTGSGGTGSGGGKGGGGNTDLQAWIDKINNAWNQKQITAVETEQLRQLARSLANKDGSLGPKDRDTLTTEFNKAVGSKGTTPVKGGGNGPGKGGGNGPGKGSGGNNGGNNGGQGGSGSGGKDGNQDTNNDGIPDSEEDDPEAGTDPPPTVKGGGKKIDIPKPNARANIVLDKDVERLHMPNIDKKITKEVERVTLQLIKLTKEFIEGGVNYQSLDYIADSSVVDEDGNYFYNGPDLNTPPSNSSDLAEERAEQVKGFIQEVFNTGVEGSKEYNYAKYIDLFELRYNKSGTPYYKLNIELTGTLVEDLAVYLVNEEGE